RQAGEKIARQRPLLFTAAKLRRQLAQSRSPHADDALARQSRHQLAVEISVFYILQRKQARKYFLSFCHLLFLSVLFSSLQSSSVERSVDRSDQRRPEAGILQSRHALDRRTARRADAVLERARVHAGLKLQAGRADQHSRNQFVSLR